jgi:hypothetical protein
VLLALPWYLAVVHGNPGLLHYFIGDEVYNRIATDEFGRHGEWYGWLQVYAPTLLLGTMPWTPVLWRWARGLPADLRRWRKPETRAGDAAGLLLALWVLLPLLVFCLARSRLPLYLLPLFLPLSPAGRAAVARGRPPAAALGAGSPDGRRCCSASSSSPRRWTRPRMPRPGRARSATASRARSTRSTRSTTCPATDCTWNSGWRSNACRWRRCAMRRASTRPYDEDPRARTRRAREPNVVWHTPLKHLPAVRERVEALGYRIELLGAPLSRPRDLPHRAGRAALAAAIAAHGLGLARAATRIVRNHPGEQADPGDHQHRPGKRDAMRPGLAQEQRAQRDREQHLGGLHRLRRAERGRVVADHAGGLEEQGWSPPLPR